jgi:hypothetical protein
MVIQLALGLALQLHAASVITWNDPIPPEYPKPWFDVPSEYAHTGAAPPVGDHVAPPSIDLSSPIP